MAAQESLFSGEARGVAALCGVCGKPAPVRQGKLNFCLRHLPKREEKRAPAPAAREVQRAEAYAPSGVTFRHDGAEGRVVDGRVVWTAERGSAPAAEASEVYLSQRTWAKGSARHAGPAVSQGAVVVVRSRWVKCEDCTSLRPTEDAGRHGAMPARPGAGERPPAWPMCPHRVPYYSNCVGKPCPPPCCAGGVR